MNPKFPSSDPQELPALVMTDVNTPDSPGIVSKQGPSIISKRCVGYLSLPCTCECCGNSDNLYVCLELKEHAMHAKSIDNDG